MEIKHTIQFTKYQGTGNDFVMIDNRSKSFPKESVSLIKKMCDRRFGIGADGLILLEDDEMSDFKMVYFNSDGQPSSMCGNGGRCLVAFAKELGLIENKARFNAVDGLHEASIHGNEVALHMIDVTAIKDTERYSFLDTGSPHHVQQVSNLEELDVFEEGARIRYGLYGEKGSNINFVEQLAADTFMVRTYERGVEAETLSCGTGVTAVALAMKHTGKAAANEIQIETKGGKLMVAFETDGEQYTQVWLTGPATKVFQGIWNG